MKALHILIFVAVLFISSTLSAQTKLPKLHEPSANGRYLQQPFKSPVKQLMTTDSLTQSEIQSRLIASPPRNKTNELPSGINSQSSQGKIPANPKDYMNYTDLNGNQLYRPKSSLSLMRY